METQQIDMLKEALAASYIRVNAKFYKSIGGNELEEAGFITVEINPGFFEVTITDEGRAYLVSLESADIEDTPAIEPTDATLGDELFATIPLEEVRQGEAIPPRNSLIANASRKIEPAQAASMHTALIAAKDEHIARLEQALNDTTVNRAIFHQAFDMSEMAHEAAKAHIERLEADKLLLANALADCGTVITSLTETATRREAILSKHREFVRDMSGYSFSDQDDRRYVFESLDELERGS